MNNNIIRDGNGTEYKEQNRVSSVSAGAIESEEVNPVMKTGVLFDNRIVPVYVSTKVAASLLGISANALRIRKCRGEIECRYFGKALRFDVTYLQTLFHEERKNVERSN